MRAGRSAKIVAAAPSANTTAGGEYTLQPVGRVARTRPGLAAASRAGAPISQERGCVQGEAPRVRRERHDSSPPPGHGKNGGENEVNKKRTGSRNPRDHP